MKGERQRETNRQRERNAERDRESEKYKERVTEIIKIKARRKKRKESQRE